MASKVTVYTKSDQQVKLPLTDSSAAAFTGATVTVSIVGLDGSAVATGYNTSMAESSTPGTYILAFNELFNPAIGSYTARISATKSGVDFYGELAISVKIRKI